MVAVDINQIPLDIDRTSDWLFSEIINDIAEQGFSIKPNALPLFITEFLSSDIVSRPNTQFQAAGIGRNHKVNHTIRTDLIHWLATEETHHPWLKWAQNLRSAFNQHLYLGLKDFESHYSIYQPGSFYKKHIDAFKGTSNRRITVIVYLNKEWNQKNGGELVLYRKGLDAVTVLPTFGTVVCFLSEEFPHEVLQTNKQRFAITGWFR